MSKATTTMSRPTRGVTGRRATAASIPMAPTGKSVPTTKTRAKTLRLEPRYEDALGFLKAVVGTSVNKMVNEAVGQYLERETARVEVNLGNLLTQVKAYRKADPDFSLAHTRVVDAEAAAAGKDPADGTLYTEPPVRKRRPPHA